MTRREVRIGIVVVVALGLFVFLMLVIGSLGPVRPELERLTVAEVLAGASPAERYGTRELRIVGWYAELDADCEGTAPENPAAGDAAWLAADCPLRVLLPEQLSPAVTQAELERDGLRLSAPIGRPFPARAQPEGPNLRMQQLVFVGRFDDPAASACPEPIRERCRNTFVVTDHDGLLR